MVIGHCGSSRLPGEWWWQVFANCGKGFSDNAQSGTCFTTQVNFISVIGDVHHLPGLQGWAGVVPAGEAEDDGTDDIDTSVVCSVHFHVDRDEIFFAYSEAAYYGHAGQTALATCVSHRC